MTETRVERRARERREEERRLASQDQKRKKQRKQEKERRQRRKFIGGIVAIVIVLLLGFTILRVWMESRPGAAEPIVMAGSGEFDDENRVNILFLGTNQGLSDTIMLFSLNFESMNFNEISIPRDTYYYRAGYSGAAYQKINSVYSTEGVIAAARAASNVLGGVPIHYYVILEPDGVKRIVDSMGGIMINVPVDMQYVDVDQGLYIDLRPGTQLLSGDQAMQYLRFRGYANADLGRISAQQEFLTAVLFQSAGLDLPRIAITGSREADTNMSLAAQAALMTRAAGLQGGSFSSHTIPGTPGMQDGASYYFHDSAATKELMRSIYSS